jgi:hypothetical protein
MRLSTLSYAAALLLTGLASGTTPAAADGCGYNGCGAPAPVVVYRQSSCDCGGSSYYYSYAPAYAYPSEYYGYGGYGYARYGYAAGAYAAAVAPYRYVNRFYGPRVYVGPRGRTWHR